MADIPCGGPLCVHYEFGPAYAGAARFEAGNGVRVEVAVPRAGKYTLSIELPQPRELPLWFCACMQVFSGYMVRGSSLLQTRTMSFAGDTLEWRIPQLQCYDWAVQLPWLPAVPLETLCGMLPLHFVVRRGAELHARFVLQRRRHCVQLAHS